MSHFIVFFLKLSTLRFIFTSFIDLIFSTFLTIFGFLSFLPPYRHSIFYRLPRLLSSSPPYTIPLLLESIILSWTLLALILLFTDATNCRPWFSISIYLSIYLFIYLSSISCILIGLDCLCTGHEVWLNLALILSFLIYLYILIYLSLLIYLSILIYILIHFFCYNLSFYSNSSFYPHLSFYPNLVKLFTLCKSIKYTLVLL